MEDLVCPYCGKKVYEIVKKGGSGAHYRYCKRILGIETKNPTFVDVAIKNFGEYAKKEFIQKKIDEGFSVLEIDNRYLKGYTRRLGNFYGIKFPSIRESASNPRTRKKYEKTCLKRFGVKNSCAAGTPGRKKAENTMKEKYGVINFFGIPNFQQLLIDKFGVEEYHRRKSERSKSVWDNKTEFEREEWIKKSIWKETRDSNTRLSRTNCSKTEILFVEKLLKLGFEIETQFKIFKNIDKNNHKHYYFYDVRLKDSNILIEFQGDYWHANPKIYKKTDIINYPCGPISAEDVWKKDKKKKEKAEKENYKLIYIWESELFLNDFNKILFNRLIEVGYENYKIEIHQED